MSPAEAIPTAVINVVGLTLPLLSRMQKLKSFAEKKQTTLIDPVFPALTCSAQSTYLTGHLPSQHGIVGNGWYYKDQAQVMLWKQSNHLVTSEKIWDQARRIHPKFTCANLFWWFNMYSSVDYSVTPRPIYRADGLKLPDIYTHPEKYRTTLQQELGAFPLFQFWGPGASIRSSQWIADATVKIAKLDHPSLLLAYIPHLDYCLQKEGPTGPSVPEELRKLDDLLNRLILDLQNQGYQIALLSEYGIHPVQNAIRLNQIFHERGWLKVREECGEDHLDPGASSVFAVSDHQIAHIYVQNPALKNRVRDLLQNTPGVESVLDHTEKMKIGVQHDRSGTLIAVAKNNFWFSYRYWLNDKRAPDYARTVDIHRKPGYDPVELFLNPKRTTILRMGARLLSKKLGFRYKMDVIPLDENLVKGSHGSTYVDQDYWPVFISSLPLKTRSPLKGVQIKSLILNHLFPTLSGELLS